MKELKQIGLFFRQHLFQIFLIILGLYLIKVGFTKDKEAGLAQNGWFKAGGFAVLFMGIISMLYVLGIINKIVHNIFLFLVLPAGLIGFAYLDYRSIDDEIDRRALLKEMQQEIKQRLRDIRDAQVEYKSKYGKYAPDFSVLKDFILNDKAITVKKEGDVPDQISTTMLEALGLEQAPDEGLTEQQAWILAQKGVISGFSRDTTYQSVMEKLFTNDRAAGTRESKYKFNIDSLDVVPFSGGRKFVMFTDFLTKNNTQVPVLLVKENAPLTKDTLMIGSLTEASTSGNWAE